jgi:serine protease
MTVLSRSLAFGLLLFNNVLGASIPRNADAGPRAAIAVKLSPATLQRRSTLSGAEIVESLIRSAQNTTNAKRDVDFSVSPLIGLSPAQIAELVARAKQITPGYVPADFGAWYQVQFQSDAPTDGSYDPELVNLLNNLGTQEEVAGCQPLGTSKSPAVNPSNDPQYANQGYLKAAPGGIEAQYAWGVAGGDGANTRVIDVERGWKLDHEDLVSQNITLLAGQNVLDRYGGNYPHGTAVLGEMLMADNNKGGVGIAPAAKGDVVGIQRTVGGGPVENPPEAILDAASFLGYGGSYFPFVRRT